MTMTNDCDEERIIHDQIIAARETVERLRKQAIQLQLERNRAEKILADIEQALLDYAEGNGILESELFKIKFSTIVEVADIAAVPDDYVRTKKEPDKRKIAAEKPSGNWYVFTEKKHVMLRAI